MSQPKTGVQRYSLGICNALLSQGVKLKVLVNRDYKNLLPEAEVIVVGRKSGVFWEQVELPAYLKKAGSPKLVNLGNVAPVSYNNNFLIVHDVATLENEKGWFSTSFRAWYRWLLPKLLKSCELATVSEFTAGRIRELTKLDEGKPLPVLHGGVFFDVNPDSVEPETNFEKPYILCVASHNPRKGLHLLIDAFVDSELGAEFDLRLVGSESRHFPKMNLRETTCFKWHRNVSDEELIALYKSARLVVVPSEYEGFGLPVLEALYFGKPVLANDIPVFRELFSEWIELIDCQNRTAFSEKLREATAAKNVKETSREMLYSFYQTAAKLRAILKK
ncbi:glycosyltransferase family 4 protein [Halocola ammonii]